MQNLLVATAAVHPDRLFTVGHDRTVTYGEAVTRAATMAAALAETGHRRIACVVDDVQELLVALAASAHAGVEACVYPSSVQTVDVLADQFDHDLIVSDRDGLDTRRPVVHPRDLLAPRRPLARPLDPPAPLLILTTGTTGRPRGARHDWRRLSAVASKRPSRPDARWLLAYSPNQFGAYQVILHAVAGGATLVIPRSIKPLAAMDAIQELGVTHASATPTFWRIIATHAEPGTGATLQQITLGGEAVPAVLLDQLDRMFPGVRVSQIYGATEFGTGIAVSDAANGLPLSATERADGAEVQLRIVDGELWVRSRAGMLGYYGEPDVGDEWRPTGDLVQVSGDRIQFVGRRSEIINVGGVKVHPLPIEDVVASVDGVVAVRAYGLANPVTGSIVALEVVARRGVDNTDLEARVRDACRGLDRAAQPRRIRFVAALTMTDTKLSRGPAVEPEPAR